MIGTDNNKLFVTEEEDEGIPTPAAVKNEEVEDIDMQDFDNSNAPGYAQQYSNVDDEDEDEEDPIIESFPVNIAGNNESLYIFQYASKPKVVGKKPAEHPFINEARYKKKSSLWELDIPLDENSFFNSDKADGTWGKANIQTLKGVGVPNDGQYTAFVANGQIYLTPIKTVAQLRPFFNYIDASNQERKQEEHKQNASAHSQRAQVVTMSVKSANDQTHNRLTGSLLAHKVADEEESEALIWAENTYEQFKEDIIKETERTALKPLDTKEDYLTKLI
ncbi:DNA-directed RNA polymerase III subunit C37 NDAI_0B05100 [Naumovozyma dairenensis CBS 421]|uniref:DNA-directed RNA polymerase III subunit RPC5 n=1 Tax=Naumovozyma dairenensis (strain ATCC 10597 / BCRC 20456 / CBS 421 / NBRC 0211 / NRRL Y-12639) TaxID=1071378 RepID=G0W6Y2_NAUDC|nr:hypothetical protein NDAI_0B05100 [Naumovozyma dairenensis CBS 421]CCD23543.1 hypothetical protein NDAI_0B05100 [Naumovozyma dairenensis CBS 421]